MDTKERFLKHYKEGYMPWAHDKPDFNLVETVKNHPIAQGKTLEIGCGTGTDAIWLSQQGFDVLAVDAVNLPIEMAIKQAKKEGVSVDFRVLDFLKEPLPVNSFDFIFDRGYFHSYDTDQTRKEIANKVASLLNDDGLWLSLLGSCDGEPREKGPPMRSLKNVVDATESSLEIISIKTSVFGTIQENPAKIWACLFKKRN